MIELIGPAITASDGGVAYRLKVKGKIIVCRFSEECLEDVDPNRRKKTVMERFEANQQRLIEIAKDKIEAGAVTDGVVWVLTSDL